MSGKVEKPNLCTDDCAVILVTGYRGQETWDSVEKRAREAAWIMHSHLLDIKPSKKKSIYNLLEVIVNDSGLSCGISSKNIEQIQEALFEMPTKGPGISRILLAHSFGANVAYEALKGESLLKFLQIQEISDSDAQKRIETIRQKLAVITLGGTQEIPHDFGKISINVFLNEDYKAVAGKGVLAENHGKEVTILRFKGGEKNELERKKIGWFQSKVESASASSNSTGGQHYLHEYYNNDELMDKICSFLTQTAQEDIDE